MKFLIDLLTFGWWRRMRARDPAHSCSLHKDLGCVHVDGMMCDFPKCSMLKLYETGKSDG